MNSQKTILESNNFIVLDNYNKWSDTHDIPKQHQSEAELEKEFIDDLVAQGYEYVKSINNAKALLENAKKQIETLNDIRFNDDEWQRFQSEYLCKASDDVIACTRKIQNDHIYDFRFDDGKIRNIYILDKKNIIRNKVQVISQFEHSGNFNNRYDVTILVNGLPLVQVELKARGKSIKEAFNQIHRYSKESFNSESSLYKYIQIFVISNGTDSRYFANTVSRDQKYFDFTMNWAKSDNSLINDLKDFTATFFQKHTLLNIIIKYSVLNVDDILYLMRPYQIAAAERILWKIKSSYESKNHSKKEGFGYIWHTTGSGKTLTSFKTSMLAKDLPFIDKVLFVVDRKDLDYQTMKEYQKFSPDSVNGSNNTDGLKKNLERNDNKIVVTTLQKLNNLIRSNDNLDIYKKQVVFIFDEAHRSQFGEAQKNIRKKFKFYYQFGFTGTPIFAENAVGSETTADVFGVELHSYVITDAIRDQKVLKFKVDYNDVRPKFREAEKADYEEIVSKKEYQELLLNPNRINEISRYILQRFDEKTHRNNPQKIGFNAMFAVSSVQAAKLYYEELNKLQEGVEKPLNIATIFSFSQNEEQKNKKGDIEEEVLDPSASAMDSNSKEFLIKVIDDYNNKFSSNFSIDKFQEYYKDLSNKVKEGKIDLLIVVGMFLTGFDAPRLNTLFVDKNLSYHGLIQAYSRTNRILGEEKAWGNIVCFRNLEKATEDAIMLFGNSNTRSIIIEKSFEEYLNGFEDIISGKTKRGYIEIMEELTEKFPDPIIIKEEKDKMDFAKLFGEYLKINNLLSNFDEYNNLKAFQNIDKTDEEAINKFKEDNYLSDEDIKILENLDCLSERQLQDYKSVYNDIRAWIKKEQDSKQSEKKTVLDWDNIVFEVDLLKSQDINLDYILALIFESSKNQSKDILIENVSRIIRSSLDNRAKESLILDYIQHTDLSEIEDKTMLIESFFHYAQEVQRKEAYKLIEDEALDIEGAKRYILDSLKQGYATDNGTDLSSILPKMNRLAPQYTSKKQTVFERISAFVDKFKGIGGTL